MSGVGVNEQTGQRPSKETDYSSLSGVHCTARGRVEAAAATGVALWEGKRIGGPDIPRPGEGVALKEPGMF